MPLVGMIDRLLDGTRWGRVTPRTAGPPVPSVDGRTAVLERFADYLHEVVFQVPDPPGPPRPYQIDRDRFVVEWPDSETDLKFPSVVFEPGHYELSPKGLTPYADEGSRDVHGPGTVLVCSYEYVERVTLAVWASTRAQRRSTLAGIEWALAPVEEIGGIRLRVPEYYGQTAMFTPLEGENVDVEDSARRRRRSTVVFEVRFDLVTLRRYEEIVPLAEVATYEASDPTYEEVVASFPQFKQPG
jgi:hypothetical protein